MVLMLLSTIAPCRPGGPSPLSPLSMSKYSPSFFAVIAPVFNHDGPEDDTPATPYYDNFPNTPSESRFSFLNSTITIPSLRPPPLNPAARTLQKALPPIPQEEQEQEQEQEQVQATPRPANHLPPLSGLRLPSTPPPSSATNSQRRLPSHIRSGSAPQNTLQMKARGLRKSSMPFTQTILQPPPRPGPAPLGPLPEIPKSRSSQTEDSEASTNVDALAYSNVGGIRNRSSTMSFKPFSRSVSPFARKPVPVHAKSSSTSSASSFERSMLSPRMISSPRPILSPRVDSLPSRAPSQRSLPLHSHSSSSSSTSSSRTVPRVNEEDDSPLNISIAMSGVDLDIRPSPTESSNGKAAKALPSNSGPETPRHVASPAPSSHSTSSSSSSSSVASYFSSVQVASPSFSLTSASPTPTSTPATSLHSNSPFPADEAFFAASATPTTTASNMTLNSTAYVPTRHQEEDMEIESMDVPLLIESRSLLQSPRTGEHASGTASASFSRSMRPLAHGQSPSLSKFAGAGQGIGGTLASVQEVF